jgi:RNA-directed DNA polymerase
VTWKQRGEANPETFTFLGFTHYCGERRSDKAFIVWRKTATKRMVAKLRVLKAELRRQMHQPAALVGEWLRKAVMGYYRYHAVPGQSRSTVYLSASLAAPVAGDSVPS